ncbi:unnamed protein product [Aspergillus oryzae]|uniref:Unnamed protein product n=2 Tax=Aspergillus oryzae TaxID=5062 RepID=A0AAN5C3J7_ASPOZ|nr:unnamed protein product [Aspergillus oryzae]GMF92493.1 unnamed protein product [Aspergillus oryzae]GMG03247.1 unnamed protein product [Aspergillus oryzae]GMG37801.1 unnamed protein product [Aspergillus oryzae]GMG46216.1 unnamed protein product [Aspergillus oryzae var. brunneus]
MAGTAQELVPQANKSAPLKAPITPLNSPGFITVSIIPYVTRGKEGRREEAKGGRREAGLVHDQQRYIRL